jgi:hypothetical protein
VSAEAQPSMFALTPEQIAEEVTTLPKIEQPRSPWVRCSPPESLCRAPPRPPASARASKPRPAARNTPSPHSRLSQRRAFHEKAAPGREAGRLPAPQHGVTVLLPTAIRWPLPCRAASHPRADRT